MAALAERQHGLVTFNQLAELGVGRGAIQRWAASGRLHRLHVGVFAVGHAATTERAQLLAAVMACGNEAALSHLHAAHVWDLLPPWVEVAPVPTHVTVPRGSGRGRRPRIIVHRASLLPEERRIEDAIPISSVARTVVDYAAGAKFRDLERLVDQAITEGRLSRRELESVGGCRRPGAGAVRRLLSVARRFESLTDSELEEQFLRIIRGAGLPAPTLGQRIGGMKVDAIWRAERVAVELDGYRWHRTAYRQDRDRRREARLRQLGWLPVRYSAAQVFDAPLTVVSDVTSVLVAPRS